MYVVLAAPVTAQKTYWGVHRFLQSFVGSGDATLVINAGWDLPRPLSPEPTTSRPSSVATHIFLAASPMTCWSLSLPSDVPTYSGPSLVKISVYLLWMVKILDNGRVTYYNLFSDKDVVNLWGFEKAMHSWCFSHTLTFVNNIELVFKIGRRGETQWFLWFKIQDSHTQQWSS